jgi:transcriptional regulator with XRE-family HTH domain
MAVGDRIESLLRAKGWTQSELARRVGMPQSTLSSLIRRGSRSSPHLVRIARELGTTPAYLSLEVDDPELEFPTDSLTSDERALLELARRLTEKDFVLARQLIARLAQPSPTLHDEQHTYRGET